MKVRINYLIYEVFKFIMDLENYFKNGKVYIWKETFAIIKAKKPYPDAFANIIDKNETTDHILVKEKDLTRAVEKLKELGCVVEEK